MDFDVVLRCGKPYDCGKRLGCDKSGKRCGVKEKLENFETKCLLLLILNKRKYLNVFISFLFIDRSYHCMHGLH